MLDVVHTGMEVHKMDSRCVDLWNDLGFSLCTVPFVCYVVTTLDNKEKSKMEVSADLVYCH